MRLVVHWQEQNFNIRQYKIFSSFNYIDYYQVFTFGAVAITQISNYENADGSWSLIQTNG